MSSTFVALGGALAVVGALGGVVAVRARRRAVSVAQRRRAALERVAASLEHAAAELDTPLATRPRSPTLQSVGGANASPADPTTGLPTRAALVDALVKHVDEARTSGGRLGLALVSVTGPGLGESAIAEVAAAVPSAGDEIEAFRVGEHVLALVLTGRGRAAVMAAVARLEAGFRAGPKLSATVVELEAGEDAAELLARATLESRSRG